MTSPLFSQWSFPESPEAGVLAFDAPADQEPQPAVWRLDLPAEPQAAHQRLDEFAARSQASNAALDNLPEQMERLASQAKAVEATSFEATTPPDLSPAEEDLLRFLAEIERPPDQVSFGLGDDLRQGWQAASTQFQETTWRALRALSHMAWVETSQGGRLFGRTSVGWTGDMQSFYIHGVLAEQIRLHQRSLALALTSRHAFIRAFSAAIAGASRLAVSLATPGGALLALPAVWKYINQILSEVERVKTLSQTQGV
jgi:hypothetical protein